MIMMQLLGYPIEIEDIARVTVGVTLGLLTVYRRELSSNRAYHDEQAAESGSVVAPEESDEWSRATSDCDGNPEDGPSAIPRRKSLSALHGEELPVITDEQLQSKATRRDAMDRARQSDHLDELLDSAGTVFSGGPFLAVGTAVLDHLVFNSLAGAYASMSTSFRNSFAERVHPLDEDEGDTPKKSEENESPGSSTVGPIHQQFIYNVAWNAATDYFSSKLESASGTSGDEDDDKSQSTMRKIKSTSNLIPLSDMQTRELLYDMIDMAGRGNMDINLLPSEQQIQVFSYLSPADVLAFTCTNLAARSLLTEASPNDDEGEVTVEDPAEDGTYRSTGNTALLIWKALFQRDFAWILSDWQIGREALVRSLRIGGGRPPRRAGDSIRSEVLRHVLSAIAESGNDDLRSIDVGSVGSSFPLSSMKEFYFVFAETWLNYTIAGCNSTEKCLIGLHGHVFDISDFVEAHPGSTETLLIQSGRDSTVRSLVPSGLDLIPDVLNLDL